MRISESFQQLLRVDQESVWCDALFALGHRLGFDRCLVAIVPKRGMSLEQAYLRSNYPDGWRSFYDAEKLVHVDPTVAHCVAHSTSLVWSPGLFRSGPQRVMYEEASAHGLRSGVTLPMHGPTVSWVFCAGLTTASRRARLITMWARCCRSCRCCAMWRFRAGWILR